MAAQNIHVNDYDREEQKYHLQIAGLIIIATFILIILRLIDLQLVEGRHFEKMSKGQKLRQVRILAVRGNISDRNGQPMAMMTQSYDLYLYADPSITAITDLSGSVAELLNVPKEEMAKKFEKRRRTANFQPTVLLENMNWSQIAALEENLTQLDCLEIIAVPRRIYPQGVVASQLLGYLGEVTGKEFDSDQKIYEPGDLVGRMGVEQGWEDILRGVNGKQEIVVDSTGRRNELFEKEFLLSSPKPPVPGKNIELTIDLDLQRATEQILGESAGAAVVMDVNTGEILALASTPGFDPNHMMVKLDPEEWKRLSEDPRRPFFDRPVQGEYPPGSVFKIVVAAAALEERIVGVGETFECRGVVELGANRDKYHCWNAEGHGYMDLYNSLVQSCDIYYYRIGELLGIEAIGKYAKNFGLGYLSKIGLPGEKAGLAPNPLWKRRFIGKTWYLGDTVITAIGQGYTLLTPLQVTRMMSVIANGGKLLKPTIIRRLLDNEGKVIEDFVPTVEVTQVVSPQACKIISRALIGVVYDTRGTAFQKFPGINVKVAAKTGTAQVISRTKKAEYMAKQGEIPWQYLDQAWITAFAPANNPKIAVTVLIEHGGSGSGAAAPLCAKIINQYITITNQQASK